MESRRVSSFAAALKQERERVDGPAHVPSRRVIYSSWRARIARVAVGTMFIGVTLWQALPVISSEAAPPSPAALFVGLNGFRPPQPESTLHLVIHSAGCHNPATIEGYLERPERSWDLDRAWVEKYPGAKATTEAEISLAGASLSGADAGLAGGEDPVGVFEESMVSGTGTLLQTRPIRSIVVHNRLSLYLHQAQPPGYPPVGGIALSAPQWPSAHTALHFFLEATLIRPRGFNSCYVDVPALFGSGGGVSDKSLLEAYGFTQQRALEQPGGPHGTYIRGYGADVLGEVPGIPDVDEVAKAEISVYVGGHVVDGSSVGSGATSIPNGVYYTCASVRAKAPAVTSPTCAGSPVFEVPGRGSDITRRLFLAGIIGAIGVTLIIEALFLGETASRRQPQASDR
jgi:hypothetical protein